MRALLGKEKKGVVLLVASIAGYSKQFPAPIYSASKHAVVGFVRSMGDAQALQGVKVVAICPGYAHHKISILTFLTVFGACSIVSTPIWTTGTPGAGERFAITNDIAITATEVAAAMADLIQSDTYPGGTIFEISKLGTRIIPEWHIDPPGMVDGKMAPGTDVSPEAIQKAMGPIFAITAAETGALIAK